MTSHARLDASADTSSTPRWLARWSPLTHTTLPENIAATEVRAVENPVHENQRVEKSFTVFTSNAHDQASAISSVHEDSPLAPSQGRATLRSPGLTVVRVRPELLDEHGPDVVARVRVSSDAEDHLERVTVELSDEHALTVGYNAPKRGTTGHLVTEIDVARESQIQQVIAMGGGDVVVHDGVLGRTSIPDDGQKPQATLQGALFGGGLLSLCGSRLFVTAPQTEMRFHALFVGATGTSSVHVDAKHVVVTKDLFTGVLGSGHVDLVAQHVDAPTATIAAMGSGHTVVETTRTLHTGSLSAHVRGDGLVRVAAPPFAILEPCLAQKISVGRGGTVDLADVPSVETQVAIARPAEGVARVRAPLEQLTVDLPNSSTASVEYTGELSENVRYPRAWSHLTALGDDGLETARGDGGARANVPTIEAAFETPVALEAPREGWFLPALEPAVRCSLPF